MLGRRTLMGHTLQMLLPFGEHEPPRVVTPAVVPSVVQAMADLMLQVVIADPIDSLPQEPAHEAD